MSKVGAWYEGDRVRVQRGDCTNWSHDSHWAPNGTVGTVSGSWLGHPGIEDGHHVSVQFTSGGHFVADLSFREDELELVRRGGKRKPLPAVDAANIFIADVDTGLIGPDDVTAALGEAR